MGGIVSPKQNCELFGEIKAVLGFEKLINCFVSVLFCIKHANQHINQHEVVLCGDEAILTMKDSFVTHFN